MEALIQEIKEIFPVGEKMEVFNEFEKETVERLSENTIKLYCPTFTTVYIDFSAMSVKRGSHEEPLTPDSLGIFLEEIKGLRSLS